MRKIVLLLSAIAILSVVNVEADEINEQNRVYYVTDNTVAFIPTATKLPESKAELFSRIPASQPNVLDINNVFKKGISEAMSTLDATFFANNALLKNSKVQEIEVYIDVSVEGKVQVLGGSLKSGIKVKMVSIK